VPQQQGQDIGNPTPNLVVEIEDHAVDCSFTRAGGFVWKYFPLSACFDNNENAVISCTGALEDRPPSLLPFPRLLMAVANLCSRRNGHLCLQSRCRSTRTARIRHLQVRTRVHWQSMLMASCTVLFPLALPRLLPFPLLGAQTRLLPSRLPALMMAFFPLLTSPPVFLLLLPSGARALSPRAWVRLNRLLLHSFLVCHPRPLGRIPFPFLPSPLPSFLHLLLISLLSSRLFLFLHPSSHPCLRFLRHFTLFFFTFVKSHSSVPCPFLADIARHYMSLCRSLMSFPPPSLLFPSGTGEST